MKILQKETGPLHISADIGCHSFATLPPFNMGNSIMGYGLGAAAASAFGTDGGKRAVSVMGDGGFWHNGLTSGIGNAVFNKHDDLTVIIDNGYSAATGGQDILVLARRPARTAQGNHSIVDAVKGVGVKWVQAHPHLRHAPDAEGAARGAAQHRVAGPKVIVAEGECQLNRQRRVRPLMRKAIEDGERVVRERFGVDPDTCTGDHSCIRLSGCPSLTVKDNPDPLRTRSGRARGQQLRRLRGVRRGGATRRCCVRRSIAPSSSTIPSRWDRFAECGARRRHRRAAASQRAPPPALRAVAARLAASGRSS